MEIRAFTEADAIKVSTWRYPAPYDVYNEIDWETVLERGYDVADPDLRAEQYRSLYENGELVGNFRLTFHLSGEGDYILLGIGLRPDCCGKGMGAEAMKLVIAEAERRWPGELLRLVVRPFNKRAMKCYSKVGFVPVGTARMRTMDGNITEFVVMDLIKSLR